jgi:hypothetical protein
MQGVVDECPHEIIEVGVEAALRTKHRKVGIFAANGTHISMLHSATGLPTVESLKFHPMQVLSTFSHGATLSHTNIQASLLHGPTPAEHTVKRIPFLE